MLIRVLNLLIALVWIINGFFCKILNLVPRHQQIVSEILSINDARLITVLIGIAEIVMAAWILSGYRARISAIIQIIVIVAMNILEFLLVPDLLLWGKFNAAFALLFILIIYINEFILRKKLNDNSYT